MEIKQDIGNEVLYLPISMACQIIEKYIFTLKEVRVTITNIEPHDKFIEALNKACKEMDIII